MNPDDCLFCQIIKGDIPSHTVYEDEYTYAFLDINPVSRGHTLVIPKTHAETLTEMDAETTEAVFRTVRQLSDRIDSALDPEGFNLLQNNGAAAGQEVEHVHVHIIPRYADDGFDFTFDQGSLDDDTAEYLVDALQ